MLLVKIWGFIRLTRPFFLLGGVLLYLLGVCISLASGTPFNLFHYLVGQLLVTSTQLMVHYGNEFFDQEVDAAVGKRRTWLSGGSGVLASGLFQPSLALRAAEICAIASLVFLVMVTSQAPLAGAIGLLAMLASWFYSAPPVKIITRGWGEFSASLIVAFLTPLMGWLLQTGQHSISTTLILICLPLVLIHTSMLIAFEFPDREADAAYHKRTLVVRLGMARATWVHDGLIVLAFLLYAIFALIPIAGGALGTAGLALLALPLAAWQIARVHWQGRHPEAGYSFYVIGAMGLFGLVAILWIAELILKIST